MDELNIVELQNINDLINYQDTFYQKIITYSSNCVDPQIKQTFTKAAQNSLNTKQQLQSFLN